MGITFRTEFTFVPETGEWIDHGGPTVDVTHASACAILVRLGYQFDPVDPYGDADADDLYGRAMVANIGLDDNGTEGHVTVGAGGGVFTDCAVAPGYFDRVMTALAELATYAMNKGVRIQWA